MRLTLVLLLLALPLSAAETGYVLNGQAHPADPAFDAIPQSGRITAAFKDVPVEKVLEEISRQAGTPVKFWMGEGAPVTLSAERAPLLAVLAALCKDHGWGLELMTNPEGIEELNVSGSTDCPVRAYAVRGPLLLLWHGLITSKKYDFDQDPPGLKEVTKYRMGLVTDPLSHIEVVDRERQMAARDFPALFKPAEGPEVELKSDHKPNTFGSGPPWEFAPREGLAGSGSLTVALAFEAPSRLEEAVLPFKPGARTEAGETELSLESADSKTGKVRDPKDRFEQIEALIFTTVFKLVRPGAGVPAGMPEAKEAAAAMTGVRAAHRVSLVLEDGRVLAGGCKSANGISSPWHGYRYDASFQAPAAAGKAKEIRIAWARGFSTSRAELRIDGVGFEKP